MATLITFQMQGWVAADVNGPVSVAHAPDCRDSESSVSRKKTVSDAPFTASPPKSEQAVYMDEFIWAIDRKFSKQNIFGKNPTTQRCLLNSTTSPSCGTRPISRRRVPIVSPSTLHREDHRSRHRLKTQFPDLVIFALHIWLLRHIRVERRASARRRPGTLVPDRYLLRDLKLHRSISGSRSWTCMISTGTPEATDSGGARVTKLNNATLTTTKCSAIVRVRAVLWDASYKEKSWNHARSR